MPFTFDSGKLLQLRRGATPDGLIAEIATTPTLVQKNQRISRFIQGENSQLLRCPLRAAGFIPRQ